MLRSIIIGALFAVITPSLSAHPPRYQGYPSRSGAISLRDNFARPPKGYGNVPFYWWNGDSLRLDRLMDQLDILAEAPIDGLSVSYMHTHPGVDKEANAHGYGSFGRADAGVPAFQSDDWWTLWNKFSGECAKRGIGLGVDDYVVGWAKNGFYVDEVLRQDDIKQYQGRLHQQVYPLKPGQTIDIALPDHVVAAVVYPGGVDVSKFMADGHLRWRSTLKTDATLYIVHTTPSPELHPLYGRRLCDVYFGRFEQKLDEQGRQGINYFFQDELQYPLTIHSWSEDMQHEFQARKGYDVTPWLPALWTSIGTITPKIRLDYAQVVTELAEERYFKPIFDWHNSRGLIYGSDNTGRGMNPTEYLDYFRVESWYTAPGNDAPARGSSFRQTKVSSSASHLYQRPRTWLEAFHSMGWDSNGEWMTSQIDHHFIAGGNLVCMHGLYYSTHGGWWEWAPPCFHFRMPYWPHMKQWLRYVERMSFVLSQGVHVADVAVLYPTESMIAYPEAKIDRLWNTTDALTAQGIDFDFIDYQSLQRADVSRGRIAVAGENYRVLVLADIRALHQATMDKIVEFQREGGIVITLGALPTATTRIGVDDAQMGKLWETMRNSDNYVHAIDAISIPKLIAARMTPDFKTQSGQGKVLHRKVGEQDVYMVMDVCKGDSIFFRAKGQLERYDAHHGTITSQPILTQTEEGTWMRWDGEGHESRLLVFSPGQPSYAAAEQQKQTLLHRQPLDGDWEVEVQPTMNNKWGDFRLPATNELIGVEARDISYRQVAKGEKINVTPQTRLTDTSVYGYAPYMETANIDAKIDFAEAINKSNDELMWKPYLFSWQYGVKDSPGSQGFHGLKGKLDNRFIILDQGCHQLFRTHVYAPQDGLYRLEQEGLKPSAMTIDGQTVVGSTLHLSKGWHRLLLAYANTKAPKKHYTLEGMKENTVDRRDRSAVVIYPEGSRPGEDNNPYGNEIAMKWYRSNHLIYSVVPQNDASWLCQIETAPGTTSLDLSIDGTIMRMWADGKLIASKRIRAVANGHYQVSLDKNYTAGTSLITLLLNANTDAVGPAIFRQPVKMTCRGGRMPLGNWTSQGALKCYSGGINYIKEVDLAPLKEGQQVVLSIGKVNATCEVKVNGELVDVLVGPPYTLAVTRHMKPGKNRVEILVYSTLANHYQTIPSPYRGEPVSGLMGPVELLIYDNQYYN